MAQHVSTAMILLRCLIQHRVSAQTIVWVDTTTVLTINATTTMPTTQAALHLSSTQPPQ